MRLFPAICALTVFGVALLASAPPVRGATNMSFGVTVGTGLPKDAIPVRAGRARYLVYHGSFYQQVRSGYVLVPAPIAAIIRDLPRGAEKFKIGKITYYRHAGIFFQGAGNRFKVCEDPTAEAGVTAPDTDAPTIAVLLGDDESVFRKGRFFRRSEDGLIGRSAPIGAVAKSFPPDAMSVWYQDGEYYESYGVFFKEVSDGFKVIVPPWQKPLLPVDDATTLAAEH